MTRAALYLRVSTDDGRQTAENQKIALTEYAARKKWTVTAIYEERISGAVALRDRPQLVRLFADAALGRFDAVLVFSLSRLSRGGAGETTVLIHRLNELGVGLVSATEEFITTAGPFGPACVAIMATLAKIERDQMSERVRAGLVRARKQGKLCHRPRRRTDPAAIAALRSQGLSLSQIGERLGVSKATIARRLNESKGASA